ncbi:MAG: CPBP family intramembrane metalloprotease [Deltaproteobacteria bacterium]|nr:CPBP family intramembrane metalloprotease [Deltaproteobacteria bacterium]
MILFLKAGMDGERIFASPVTDFKTASYEEGKPPLLILVFLCVPFYVNDFSDIYVKDWRLWLFIDYAAVKLFPLLVLSWVILKGKMKPAELGLTRRPAILFVTVFAVGTLAVIFIEQNRYAIFSHIPLYLPLGIVPEIEGRPWLWIDLTVGLLLVAIIEELVFRGYVYRFLLRYIPNTLMIVVISALGFGLIHWSRGLIGVLSASAAGAVFMALYIRTRSLPPIILAHFAVNFIELAPIMPEPLFRFY